MSGMFPSAITSSYSPSTCSNVIWGNASSAGLINESIKFSSSPKCTFNVIGVGSPSTDSLSLSFDVHPAKTNTPQSITIANNDIRVPNIYFIKYLHSLIVNPSCQSTSLLPFTPPLHENGFKNKSIKTYLVIFITTLETGFKKCEITFITFILRNKEVYVNIFRNLWRFN